MTTQTTSSKLIRQLLKEAEKAGDISQVKLCKTALRGGAGAKAECLRTIAEAQAQNQEEVQ